MYEQVCQKPEGRGVFKYPPVRRRLTKYMDGKHGKNMLRSFTKVPSPRTQRQAHNIGPAVLFLPDLSMGRTIWFNFAVTERGMG